MALRPPLIDAALAAAGRYRRTSVRSRCSRVAAGSAVSPVCTAEGWMIVDEGDTSQWNRSGAESTAIGPAAGSPYAIPTMAAR
jgi:hypothetical protein